MSTWVIKSTELRQELGNFSVEVMNKNWIFHVITIIQKWLTYLKPPPCHSLSLEGILVIPRDAIV